MHLYRNILIALVVVRLFMDLFGEWKAGDLFPSSYTSPTKKAWHATGVPDDKEIARTSYLYLKTGKYYTDVSLDRPKFREEKMWESAFRNRYNVWFFAVCIQASQYFGEPIELNEQQNIPDGYFSLFMFTLFVLKWISFITSLFYLYKCAIYLLNESWAYAFLFCYILYPSNFYIFPLNGFDSISMSVLTIFICKLLLSIKQKETSIYSIISLGLLACLAFILKFHTLIVVFAICLSGIVYCLLKKKKGLIPLFSGIILMHGIAIIPLVLSTKQSVGHYVFSTQSSINLFHGHNPAARGSWTPVFWRDYGKNFSPILENHKAELMADEYTETSVYRNAAMKWATNHIKEEIVLSLKKVAIFFLPHNFMNWKINIVTLITHLCFLIFTAVALFKFKTTDISIWILLVSVWSIVAFNVLFFVEYRWRYFIEPEMLLLAFIFIFQMFKRPAIKSL